MAYVIKIKYETSLRRLTLQKNELGEEGLSFAKLEGRIRDLFQIPTTATLGLTYTDTENDVVTMSTDQDVQDALVHQSLNPLRVFVTLVKSPVPESPKVEKSIVNDTEVALKKLLRNLSSNSECVKKAVLSYEPLLEGAAASPAQATALVEKLVSTISAQVAAAVKHGTDAAALTKTFGFGPSILSGQSSGKASSSASETSSRSSDAFNGAAGVAASMAQAAAGGRAQEASKASVDPENVVHHAVGCDVCGVNPIVGMRWKSTKKYDYDLCSRCFNLHGKEGEFIRIEQSMFRPRHLHNPHGHHRMPMGPPFHPMGHSHYHGGRPFGMRGGPFGGRFQCGPMMGAGGGKLDARFVCDVTMFDGTEVTPGTRFTKIWRLRNSGSVPWPARTNLVHVGGDELGQVPMVPLEISADGLAPDSEMEAAVDLVAPEKAGRYVSHWRLASPAGPKFGHRIWVVIQVVSNESADRAVEQEAVKEDTPVQTPESNTPIQDDAAQQEVVAGPADGSTQESITEQEAVATSADSVGEKKAEEVTARLEPTMSFVRVEAPVFDGEGDEAESLQDSVDVFMSSPGNVVVATPETPKNEAIEFGDFLNVDSKTFDFPTAESTAEAATAEKTEAESTAESSAAEKTEGEPITYPVLDVTRDQGLVAYPVIETAVAEKANEPEPASESDLSTPNDVLLGKLEAMGFTDSKLNLELLEKNNNDMRKTLNDLCTAEEWDPILEELEEMGFYDAEVNRRLMFKNNGSVKRVVKELVQMYRDLQGKGKSVE